MHGRGGGYGRGPVGFGFGGSLSITPMVRNIIVANCVIWFITWQSPSLIPWFWVDGDDFLPWQPFTYMWLHDTRNLMHVVSNMLGLFFFGCDLERVWGSRRFLRFYLMCGVGAGFIIWLADLITSPSVTLGASGAVFGVMTAYAIQWPNRTIQLIFPPIPIRAMYLIPVLFLLQLSMREPGVNISHVGHLGGVIMALLDQRQSFRGQFKIRSLRYQWNRIMMRNRLRAVRREEWHKRSNLNDDDDHPTIH